VGGVKAFNSPRLSPAGVPFRTIGVMSFVPATAMILAARAADPAGVWRDALLAVAGPPRRSWTFVWDGREMHKAAL
jgi:hypothetical protein